MRLQESPTGQAGLLSTASLEPFEWPCPAGAPLCHRDVSEF